MGQIKALMYGVGATVMRGYYVIQHEMTPKLGLKIGIGMVTAGLAWVYGVPEAREVMLAKPLDRQILECATWTVGNLVVWGIVLPKIKYWQNRLSDLYQATQGEPDSRTRDLESIARLEDKASRERYWTDLRR